MRSYDRKNGSLGTKDEEVEIVRSHYYSISYCVFDVLFEKAKLFEKVE